MVRSSESLVITLFATAGTGDFLLNSIRGIARCGIDPNIIHAFVPRNAEQELGGLIRAANANARILDDVAGEACDGQFPSAYLEYNTPGFNRLMKARFPVIRSLAQEYDAIVYADVDAAWLSNPLPYLQLVLRRYPMAFQTESLPVYPPMFCTGFFALRACRESFDLIDLHIRRFDESCASTQQVLFNSIIAENPRFLPLIYPLPEALFANGLLHAAVAARDTNPADLVSLLHPFIFHANFTIGSENKRRLLQLAGCWQAA